MATEIDSLFIRIESASGPAAEAIDAITASLERLKQAAKLTTFKNSLIKIADGVTALTPTLVQGKEALEGYSEGLDDVKESAKGAAKDLQNAGDKAEVSGKKAFSGSKLWGKLASGLKSIIGWSALTGAFTDGLEEAISWDGIATRFGKGFGDQAESTAEYVDRLSKELYINKQAFMQYSGVFASLVSGFGVAEDQVDDLSIGLTELAYDLYAFNNDQFSFESAMRAVKSAISGELESIRNMGISISAAMLQETAARHGITQSVDTMTESQKALLRYVTMVEAATRNGVVGTWAEELGTVEGQLRAMQQQLKGLAQAIGGLVIPVLAVVVPYMRAFVEVITDAVFALAELLGVEIQEIDWEKTAKGEDVIKGIGDSADDATGSLKKLKSYTMGFDELNVIDPNKGSGSGKAAGLGGWSLDIDRLWDESVFEKAKQQVQQLKEEVKKFLPLVVLVGLALAAWKIANFIQQFQTLMSGPLNIVGALFMIGAGLYFVIDGVRDFIANGTTAANFGKVALGIGLIAAAIWVLTGSIKTGLIAGGIMLAVAAVFMFLDVVAGSVKVCWTAITDGIKWLDNFGHAFVQLNQNMLTAVGNFGAAIWEVIKALAHNIKAAFVNTWLDVHIGFIDFISSFLSGVKTIADKANSLLGIFGISIDTAGIESQLASLATRKGELGAKKLENKDLGAAFKAGLNTFEYGSVKDALNTHDVFGDGWARDAYSEGAEWGENAMLELRKALGFSDDSSITDSIVSSLAGVSSLLPGRMSNSPTQGVSYDAVSSVGGGVGSNLGAADEYTRSVVESIVQGLLQANTGGQTAAGGGIAVYLDGKQIAASVRKAESRRGASVLSDNFSYSY